MKDKFDQELFIGDLITLDDPDCVGYGRILEITQIDDYDLRGIYSYRLNAIPWVIPGSGLDEVKKLTEADVLLLLLKQV